jgi:hypothetical protein
MLGVLRMRSQLKVQGLALGHAELARLALPAAQWFAPVVRWKAVRTARFRFVVNTSSEGCWVCHAKRQRSTRTETA